MKIKKLGRTGLKVSEVCLGTMTFGGKADEATSLAILDKAAEYGVNFIDSADCYPAPPALDKVGVSEEIIGKWLKGRRENFILATKCRVDTGPLPWDEGLSRKHILRAVEDSLRRLKTDYIDLYQAHSPDPDTPIDETMRAFDDLVRSGKVRYVGCSNYRAWPLAKALWTSERLNLARYDCAQPRYNILFRFIEDEILPLCRDEGLGVIAYNPLAGGYLTGKRQDPSNARYGQNAHFKAVEKLQTFFAPRGKSLAQVAAAWVLQQPGITSAILGASRPEQLDDTLPAVDLTLDEDEEAACDDAWFSLPRPRDPRLALR